MSPPDFETWVDEHVDALFRYALAGVRDWHAAEDLVQETFLAAMQASDSFRGESTLRTWLIGILRHKMLDYLRKLHRQEPTAMIESVDPAVDRLFNRNGSWKKPPGDWKVDPASLLERREFWAVFEKCLGDLPPRMGTAFSLRVVNEVQSSEVCKLLQISSTNLWVMLFRARVRLRACLEAHWFGKEPKEPA
jgi:RNA polymerase sigma-70 factor (ECF subfamily)